MGNIIYSPLSQTLVLSEWIRWGPLFRILGLGEAEFKSLFGFFKSLELSKHPGLISIGDLSRRLKFKSNILICSSFMIFDENWNGFCNFAEFTICLWNFCTHTPSALLFYSYQKVSGEDSDSSSIITVDDALSALKTLHWENDVQCSDWPQVLQYVATRMNGDLSPLEFDQMFPFSCPIMKPIQRVRNAIFTSVVPESSFVHADTKTYVFRGDSLSLAQLKRKVRVYLFKDFSNFHDEVCFRELHPY